MEGILKGIFGLIAAAILVFMFFLVPLNDNPASLAQSAYPPPTVETFTNPYPTQNVAYPGPHVPPVIPSLIPTDESKLASISIEISVDGLMSGDLAQASLQSFTEDTEAKVLSIDAELPAINLSNGEKSIHAENIPTGIYKLIIQTSSDYFRDPKGYIIRVTEAGMENILPQTLHFDVVSSSMRELPACWNIIINDVVPNSIIDFEGHPFVDKDICMAERLVDYSSPIDIEQLRSNPESPDYGNYYYIGPQTTQDNQGVWGRNYVVDSILIHGEEYDQFVAERVYANNGSNWIEAGWTEESWQDDRQFIYTWDSVNGKAVYDNFVISSGSPVETQVYYSSSQGKWRARYHLGDGYWAVLQEVDLGFSIADNSYNRGEAWENIGITPLLPPSMFDKGYLLINGSWLIWDTSFATLLRIDSPYQLDMITENNHFVIHSPIIYLPLVIND